MPQLTPQDSVAKWRKATLKERSAAQEIFRAPQTTEQVTQEIASQFACIADLLRRYGADPQGNLFRIQFAERRSRWLCAGWSNILTCSFVSCWVWC